MRFHRLRHFAQPVFQLVNLALRDRTLIEASSEHWPDETLAIAGAVVSVGYHGDIRVERGLVRPEDVPADDSATDAPHDRGADEPAVKLSARLIEDLSAQKSAAISAELAKRPDIALAAVVHALALDVFCTYRREDSCVNIHASLTGLSGSLYEPEQCSGFTALEENRSWWHEWLPSDPANLWAWCLDQSQENLLALLAVIAAHSIDAIVPKNGRPCGHADEIARSVSLDMTDYFTPGADNFFARSSRPAILAAIDEAKGGHGPALDKLKKAELATRAEDIVAGTGCRSRCASQMSRKTMAIAMAKLQSTTKAKPKPSMPARVPKRPNSRSQPVAPSRRGRFSFDFAASGLGFAVRIASEGPSGRMPSISQSNIDRLSREIANLNKADAREAKKEADLISKLNRVQEATARTKSASTLKSKLREAERAASDLAAVRKKRADVSGKIADKSKSLRTYQERQAKDDERARKKIADEQKRLNREREVQERSVRQLMAQQRTAVQTVLEHQSLIHPH